MSLEKNKALIRKVNEALNRMDLTILDEFMAPDYVDHTNQLRGKEDARQFYVGIFKDMPDFHRTIEDMIGEGDKVWIRFKTTGTAPTGKKVEMVTVSMLRFVNGKAVEGWTVPRVTGQNRSLDQAFYR
jgi:predicted SnoaL-like aldol condensation-catalyzing enzyme